MDSDFCADRVDCSAALFTGCTLKIHDFIVWKIFKISICTI
jgi:hypothetical protein